MDGIAQIRSISYLSVNVYPTSSGWRAAVMIRESGRPHPRLARRVAEIPLPAGAHNLRTALEAASQALLDYADGLP